MKQQKLAPGSKKRKVVPKKEEPFLLYHVTADDNAKIIKKSGLDPDFGFSEGGVAEAKAQQVIAGELDESDAYDEDWGGDKPEELITREIFNEVIDGFIHINEKKRGYPSHAGSVFFWNNPDRVHDYKQKASPGYRETYRVVAVDANKIPCQCYEGSWEKAEELFGIIKLDVRHSEQCQSFGSLDNDDKKFQRHCKHIDRAAKAYVKSLRPMKRVKDSNKEVMCPCVIPRKAIVSVEGVSPYQQTIDESISKKKKYI